MWVKPPVTLCVFFMNKETFLIKPLLTLKEASIYTSLSVSALRLLVYNNRITSYKLGGKLVYIERSSLDSYLRSNPSTASTTSKKGGTE